MEKTKPEHQFGKEDFQAEWEDAECIARRHRGIRGSSGREIVYRTPDGGLILHDLRFAGDSTLINDATLIMPDGTGYRWSRVNGSSHLGEIMHPYILERTAEQITHLISTYAVNGGLLAQSQR